MVVQPSSGIARSLQPGRGILLRLLVAITTALVLVVGLPGGAFASGLHKLAQVNEVPVSAHDSSPYAYDAALHSVQALAGAIALESRVPESDGAYEALPTATRPSFVTSQLSVATKALPSGPKIAAEWGVDTYRHGGLTTTIEHINYRHAYGSGFSGVSKYADGTSVRDIKGYVDFVLRNGNVTDRGMIGDIGRTIGTDAAGNPATGLEIIVRDGMIKTAFPVAAP